MTRNIKILIIFSIAFCATFFASFTAAYGEELQSGDVFGASMIEKIRDEFICVETGMSISESAREGALCPTGAKVLDIIALMVKSGWSPEKIESYMELFPQGESVMGIIDINGQPFIGRADAPVTMIEFFDMQCPYCGRFNSGTLPAINSEYVESGKVRYVLVSLPLGFHIYAKSAAEALYCAGDQEKLMEYRSVLFDNQRDLSEESIRTYASAIMPDYNQFTQCLDTEKYESKVDEDMEKATKAGIRGTPGFIIGRTQSSGIIRGRKVSGAQQVEAFSSVIDGLLNSEPSNN